MRKVTLFCSKIHHTLAKMRFRAIVLQSERDMSTRSLTAFLFLEASEGFVLRVGVRLALVSPTSLRCPAGSLACLALGAASLGSVLLNADFLP